GAQPLDVHVHGARLNVGGRFPDDLEQLRAALHPTAAVGERHEQLVLRRGEVDLLSIQRHGVRVTVDFHGPDMHNVTALDGLCASPAKNVADPEHQLLWAEWL